VPETSPLTPLSPEKQRSGCSVDVIGTPAQLLRVTYPSLRSFWVELEEAMLVRMRARSRLPMLLGFLCYGPAEQCDAFGRCKT
jgi:hypothetical protein